MGGVMLLVRWAMVCIHDMCGTQARSIGDFDVM